MDHYAGLDVSLELTRVCIVDAQGEIICEAKVPSEPEALIGFLNGQQLKIGRVGLKAVLAGQTGLGRCVAMTDRNGNPFVPFALTCSQGLDGGPHPESRRRKGRQTRSSAAMLGWAAMAAASNRGSGTTRTMDALLSGILELVPRVVI